MDLLTKIRGEIDLRLRELRPLVEEYERLLSQADEVGAQIGGSKGRRRSTAKAGRQASRREGSAPARAGRAPRGAGQQAIVAALEHGSHTVSELAVVTAMSGPSIRQGLRRLLVAGTVTPAKREGKTAYTLSSPRR